MATKRATASNDGVAPWERQDDEGDAAWQAFVVYRDLGLSRTYAATAAQCRKHVSLIQRWSLALNWKARTTAWDRELDRTRIASHKQAVQEMERRHSTAAALLFSKVSERVTQLTHTDMAQFTPRDIATWFKLAVELERRSLGADLVLRPQLVHAHLDDAAAFLLQHMNMDDIMDLTVTD